MSLPPPIKTASNEQPVLGAHVLSEFVFCRRAGFLTLQMEPADEGEDPAPNLSYMPDYDLREIVEALEAAKQNVWRFLTWLPVVAAILFGVGISISWMLAGLIALACWWLIVQFIHDLHLVYRLNEKQMIAEAAEGAAPDPHHHESQHINWWELRKAGFEPVKPVAALRDHAARLAGKPWMILQKGGMRIPVFLHRREDRRIFPQHHIRMAAYCYLISVAERAQSPFGIILFAGSYEGITIPMSEREWHSLNDAVEQARALIRVHQQDRILPGQPDSMNVCRQCPHGRPELYQPGQTKLMVDGIELAAYVTDDYKGRPRVSKCGTRYQWAPPHEEAIQLRLTD